MEEKIMAFTKKQINQILDALKAEYPDAGCALVHMDTYQLLIAVVLSAQTTDKSVNKISDALFEKISVACRACRSESGGCDKYNKNHRHV